MNLVIPPLVFYVAGFALVVGGVLRALMLGRRNPRREISDDDPGRARARRRHLTFGVVWVLMGLFLIASTAGVLRSKATPPARPPAAPPSAEAPTIHLEPAPPPSNP